MSQLLLQFGYSTLLVVLCVMLHGLALFNLNRVMRGEVALERIRHIRPLSPRGAVFTLSIVLTMFALHGLEIWIFAMTYWHLGAVQDLESALYFSTISYSTVGYNDTHILAEWRLLGAFESILGIFLLGWSTAFFFRMLGRIDPH